MKLSTRARYALTSMLAITRLGSKNEPVSLERIATTTRLPRKYLEHLVRDLKKAALVKSVSGRNGGYLLSRPASDILIGQIIEAAIGPINIVQCVREPEECLNSEYCECRLIYVLLNNRISQALNEFSLADMEDENWHKKVERQLKDEHIYNGALLSGKRGAGLVLSACQAGSGSKDEKN